MIDYIKSELLGLDLIALESNPLLDFETIVNTSTGELGKYSQAYFKGLKFKIFNSTSANPKGRITLEGSLHKYKNNGQHNFNDFDINDLNKVLEDLELKFKLRPINIVLTQLEIGINFLPPLITKEILNGCLMHKTELFKSIYTPDEGNYKQARHENYIVKIYDKRKHYTTKGYNIESEIMRFELKLKRAQLAAILDIKNTISLQDVLNFKLKSFKTCLIKEWNNILFYDFTTLDNSLYQDRYSNPNFWIKLKSNNFKHHRKNLNKIINSNPSNLKKKIEDLIGAKIDSLNIETTRIKPLYIPLKQVEVSVLDNRECKLINHSKLISVT